MRAPAIAVAALVVLVAFTGVSRPAAADNIKLASPSATETIYGPGISFAILPNGRVQIQHLPTFQRWDGVGRPMSALNRTTGEWPYLLAESTTSINVTRLGQSFVQAKVPGATYVFEPFAIKETITIDTGLYGLPLPRHLALDVPVSGTYSASIENSVIVLRNSEGAVAWVTSPFRA